MTNATPILLTFVDSRFGVPFQSSFTIQED